MAIVSMQKLSICAAKSDRKKILEFLQSMGAMELINEEIEDEELERLDTQADRMRYEKNAESYDRVLKILAEYAPEEKKGLAMFAGPETVKRSDLDHVVQTRKKLWKKMKAVLDADKEISECRGTIHRDRVQIEALRPWQDLGIPMSFAGTEKTACFIGTLPEPLSEEALYAAASRDLPEPVCLTAEVLGSGADMTCVTVVCLGEQKEKVEENLRAVGFARPAQAVRGIPSEEIKALEEDIAAQEAEIEKQKEKIVSFADEREHFRIAADYYRTRSEKYRILGTVPQTEHAFFLTGWVPADKADRITTLLEEKFNAFVEKEDIREGETEPTLLKNNRFSEAAEGVLASYGLPQHGRVDPTFIMSIFYVIFFGMMLSDAGYGILMFVVCAILLKKYPHMGDGLKKMMKLFFWCGLSTAFWGFMYGGFFGDAIDVVAKTFFGFTGDKVLKPLWFEPLGDPMRLLIWCMLFGLIHLYVGLGIKGYEVLKQGDMTGFICDILAWYLFLTGLVLMLIPSNLFASIAGQKFTFPAFMGPLAKGMVIAGALIILVMSGRNRKNWGLRIALGAYDLYGVTSWLSDILSYSRLLALGLATGVIASVINMMASMFGGGPVGAILFIIIFLLGHTLNLGINALGAYVHTNRLQYVEFFGKFYDAGGKAFVPFHTINKYIEVKEDQTL